MPLYEAHETKAAAKASSGLRADWLAGVSDRLLSDVTPRKDCGIWPWCQLQMHACIFTDA